MKRSAKTLRNPAAPSGSLARSSPIPLYYQLFTRMREEILNGGLEPGAQYFSDRQLIERYGVSLLTVRQAMSELVNAQILERRQGSGTFISQRVAKMRAKPAETTPGAILFTGWSPAALSGWDSMYFRDIFEGMQAEASARDLQILFDDFRAQSADKIATEAKARGIRGALALIGQDSEKRTKLLSAAGLPIVAVNFSLKGIPSIVPDDFAGGQLAVKHLLLLGHRRIAHLHSGETTPHWAEVRRAYLECTEVGIASGKSLLFESDKLRGSIDVGYELAAQMVERGNLPTAIFAGNDLIAIGAMRLLQERGINIPQDISVIGFDNIEAAEICSPGLTTIGVDRKEMGRTAVRMLLDPAAHTEPKPIGVKLVERKSTAKPQN
jgi:GntR family transcriptional regulator of arabinose operon